MVRRPEVAIWPGLLHARGAGFPQLYRLRKTPNRDRKSTRLNSSHFSISYCLFFIYTATPEIYTLSLHERSSDLRRSRFGLGYFMQGGRVFPNLTVYENLQIAASLQPSDGRSETTAQVFETFPHLANEKNRRAGLLSGGTKQLLAFALVLCRRPQILLLDEPSAGLAPALADHLFQTLRQVCATYGACALLRSEERRVGKEGRS